MWEKLLLCLINGLESGLQSSFGFMWRKSKATQSKALNLGRSSKKPPNVMASYNNDDDDDDLVLDYFGIQQKALCSFLWSLVTMTCSQLYCTALGGCQVAISFKS